MWLGNGRINGYLDLCDTKPEITGHGCGPHYGQISLFQDTREQTLGAVSLHVGRERSPQALFRNLYSSFFCFETFIVFYLISIYIQPLLNNRVSGMSNSMRMLREKVDCICSKADKVPLNRSFQREKRT